VLIFIRSLAYNFLFYANLIVLMIVALPTFFMPRQAILFMAKVWARSSVWMLHAICGTRIEWRGLEKLPPGGYLVAAKHQSFLETFALLPHFHDPTFILKRELQWIPVFGWFTIKAKMIPIDRRAGAQTIPRMMAHARAALSENRQIVIFPEGTRRPPHAEPTYKFGVVRLYAETGAPCVPIALNSGLFWPRRQFLRYPGTVVVEVLDPILPGLTPPEFMQRLQDGIETATERLLAEGQAQLAQSHPQARPA
jgi:1-acyl-sn-glycerol-3-phosphate acyltransferase